MATHEEPDAENPHVRICGGLGRATGRIYPILGGRASDFDAETERVHEELIEELVRLERTLTAGAE